ncbi:multicopper oxidase family protein [Sulfitobacter delicatus]|uniref:Multicopper oxidase with three cupredoxin domains (Includes cell division protein FtsP and spore coat protein CotA) n=1 Tax=Sulfitobacter delicatus TaxID=218672 RepID=A0A1G7KH96_9RHOB|nr:multicopper oxidase family protein [Sulfitobacter delicatus]SDF36613.1 Multicopper oxidase with three cupredoxin domains (includes cell division protein FtsP and spore coat protein CotA) [Sulfitobacter delicatus]
MNRRQFLASVSAATVLPRPGFAGRTPLKLKAQNVTQQILPEGEGATAMLGFNGSMPGPEIRLKRGAQASIEVENALQEGTAVHWHGIRLENRMDGVPVLTQELINPGDSKTYRFVPPDAGTYWYHSHYISQEQVARGLMGPLIIEDDTPPDVDHDITVLLSDWRMNKDGSLVDEYTDMHSVAHAGYMGNFARAFLSKDTVKTGDRVRFRLINAATNRIFPLALEGMTGSVVALDGMALAQPRPLGDLVLAPAQRADLIVDITGPVGFDMMSRQGAYRLADLAVSGTNTARAPTTISPLAAPDLPRPEAPSQHLTLTMMGGAMGGRHGGANIWSFNDVSDLPTDPFGKFERGETVRLTFANDTAFPHGIHLHGHHFYELAPDGSLGDLRDTTLVAAGESRDVLCVFDNPGRWLIHCHMLSHAIGGMRTWVEVA